MTETPKPIFISTHWKGSGSPVLLRIDQIESVTTVADGRGAYVTLATGKTLTVLAEYEEVLAVLTRQGVVVKL